MQDNNMEKDWDRRSREDAMHYIITREKPWDENEFFARGTKEAYELRSDFFKRKKFQHSGKCMLNIGCGIGRMERGFSEMFAEVFGTDVSEEMITKGIQLNQSFRNIKFVKGNGQDLSTFQNDFFDFVFLTLTFNHIPKKQIVFNYFSEIYRVLKPGGLFKVQVRKAWAGVAFAFGFFPIPRYIFPYIPDIIWVVYDHLALRGKRRLYRGKYWRGSGMTENEAHKELINLKFTDVEIESDPSNVLFWCCGRK